jgi:hypothetical protein
VAVSCAVGVGAVTGGAVCAGVGNGCFFLHPETASKAASRVTGTRIRLLIFNLVLLPKIQKSLSERLGGFISLPTPTLSGILKYAVSQYLHPPAKTAEKFR